jgi:hypothetical protein
VGVLNEPEGATLPHQDPTADEDKTVVAEVIQKEKVVEKKVTVRVSKPIAQRAEKNTIRGRVRGPPFSFNTHELTDAFFRIFIKRYRMK